VAALVAAATFTLASAAVYLANDVADAERDRLHPRKRHRPVVFGDLPKVPAAVLSAACAAAGTAAGLVTGVPLLTTAVAGYLVLSFLYAGPSGEVRVRVLAPGSRAWLVVEDIGPGIPAGRVVP
jgi:4-hydroxybenzoate polyprenyltransferase